MENEYLDSYERAKRADRERRSHARQMKRRRQKRLKMIKGAITAAVAVVIAVCCILYTTCGEGGGQADGIDSQQMAQDAHAGTGTDFRTGTEIQISVRQ